jgi:magnesium transporter
LLWTTVPSNYPKAFEGACQGQRPSIPAPSPKLALYKAIFARDPGFYRMIQLFQTINDRLTEIQSVEKGCWIHIVDPDDRDKAWLEENCPLAVDYLTDSLDLDEMSRVEKEPDYFLVVLRIPHFRGMEFDIPFITLPLLLMQTEHMTLTLCKEENAILQEFIRERVRGFTTHKKDTFLLQILLKTASKFLIHLRNINKVVEKLEDELENSLKNKEIVGLLQYEKALIYYTTALQTNGTMMERLRRMRHFGYEEDQDLLEDVLIENQQALQMTTVSIRIMGQMMEAFSSVINNNMNNVMKTLTFVTICLAIPTLFASLYGMNIPLPYAGSDTAFWGLLGLSGAMVSVVFLLFRKMRWF